ncbi:MAG TPA: sialidase family protein [Candidatus Thermoplasmatota archaeon]|nr:sialidase family protein [Candidatus Thermoplasmatota archaeon]
MRPSLPLLAALLVSGALLAGCADDGRSPAPEPSQTALPVHPLAGTIEPEGLDAPTFRLIGPLARTGPVYGGGEPSVSAGMDGRLYVAFPGCDRGFYLVDVPGQQTCDHGLVYRSADDGATWQRLNREGDGRYDDGEEGPAANGDAEVAVDAAGTVYASNLGAGGIQVHRSDNGGTSWTYLGNATESGESADRQWMAAAAPGHLIVTWMGSETDGDGVNQTRAVVVNTTFDGGATWTGALALGKEIGWLGPVQFAPDGRTAYIPFTQVEEATPAILVGTQTFSMRVARTLDGGATWEVLDTGARWDSVASGGHWSGVLMAPALDVTGDGAIVLAYAVDREDPAAAVLALGTELRMLASLDGGSTWTPSQVLAVPSPLGMEQRPGSPIMPWVTGGAGDRFAITYLLGTTVTDSDYEGTTWDVRAMAVDGLRSGSLAVADGLVQEAVHQGAVCSRGGACLLTGSDRAILDFFKSDVTPDGRIIVAYPSDPLQGGKTIDIRVAIQDGGTFLLQRPA